MRKRDRLKQRFRRLLGESAPAAEPVAAAPIAPPAPEPPTPEPTVAPPEPTVAPPEPPPEPPEAAEPEEDPEAAEMARKAAKHFEKTRVAMLKFIVDKGGEASMADMHDHSERRYFIAHKRFSDLMEGIVEEGLIDFDHDTGMASITSAGEEYISD